MCQLHHESCFGSIGTTSLDIFATISGDHFASPSKVVRERLHPALTGSKVVKLYIVIYIVACALSVAISEVTMDSYISDK